MPDIDSARRLIAIGDRAGALRELARLLQVNPRLLEAWLLLAEVVDDPVQKADCYRQALQLDPGNPLAQQGMERLRLQQTPIPVIEPEPIPEPTPQSEPVIQPEEPATSGEPEAKADVAPETFVDEFQRLAPVDFVRSPSVNRRRPNSANSASNRAAGLSPGQRHRPGRPYRADARLARGRGARRAQRPSAAASDRRAVSGYRTG